MSIVSDSVLVESRAARDHQLGDMPQERAQAIITKVKGLYFALWQGAGAATTEQMREFYEVKVDALQGISPKRARRLKRLFVIHHRSSN